MTGGELAQTLVREIDCAATAPDYISGGGTQVVSKPCGCYRLSGDVGFLHAQHHNVPESWFAYRIETPEIGSRTCSRWTALTMPTARSW